MIALVREVSGNGWDVSREEILALMGIDPSATSTTPDLLLLRDTGHESGLLVLLTDTAPASISTSVEQYEVRLMAGKFAGTVARVFSVQLRPGVLEQMVSAFQNLTMRVATGQQGFRGGLLLVDAKRDRVLSIGIWEDMARLEASAASGYLADQVSAYLPYFHQTPVERRMRVIPQ